MRSVLNRPLLVIVAAILLVAACSSGDDDAAPDDDTGRDDTGSETEADVETVEIELASGSTVVADIPSEPIASAPTTEDGADFEVYQLERSDDSVTLVFALHNTTDDEVNALQSRADKLGEYASDSEIGGVTLLDAVNLNLHLVFRQDNSLKTCVCSKQQHSPLDAGERRFFAAVYPAPPADVDAMTVQSGLATVSGVPLSNAA